MEIKEAIMRIKNHNEIHSRKEKHFAVHITEALNMAIEALEKQITEKPIVEEVKDYEGNIVDDMFRCPKCNRVVCFYNENDIEKEYPYCHCGQKLDWSDSE